MTNTPRVDGHSLNRQKRTLRNGRGNHHLTHLETRLLYALMRPRGQVVTRKALMKEVWNTRYVDDTRTLDVHICWLRKKLEEDAHRPVYLRTVRGGGYRALRNSPQSRFLGPPQALVFFTVRKPLAFEEPRGDYSIVGGDW
jgi:DNA-binding response OmpR family regulator